MTQRRGDALERATHQGLNAKVLDPAYELGLSASQTVDDSLAAEVKCGYWMRWNGENREAIEAYNARVKHEGLPLERYRSFARTH